MFNRGRAQSSCIFIVVLVSSFLSQIARAGFERRDQGARPIGMGGAFVAVSGNPWVVMFNPSGLAEIRSTEASVFYSPQLFDLKELSLGSFVFVQPTPLGSFGISGTRFGFELYREVTGTLSYANSYKDIFSIGINVNYNSLTIKNYGTASSIGVDLGLMATITGGLRWGFFATNINAPTIGQAKEKLPQVYSTGLGYTPFNGLLLGIDLVKDVRYPTILKAGVEYRLVDVLSLRAGVGSDPTTFSSGVGIHYSLFEFDYALTSHQDLGLSHQFSVSVRLKK